MITARQMKINQHPRKPVLSRVREEASVGRRGLGAEIRRLNRAERVSISQIARVVGVSPNTTKAALRSDGAPKHERTPSPGLADAFKPRIRQLLGAVPTMPATVTAAPIGSRTRSRR